MELEKIKNKKDFIKYIKPYGYHVAFIIGDYYELRKINFDCNLYEIKKYKDKYDEKNSMRKIHKGCEPIETMRVNSNECFKLINKEVRKQKLKRLNELNTY
jgi:hypothetical protein